HPDHDAAAPSAWTCGAARGGVELMEDKMRESVIAAAIAKLEAEMQRRIDEKIAKGEAIRVPALSVVVGTPDAADAAIEDTRARMQAADREAGRKVREVYFEEPAVIITGVPRSGRDD